MAEGTVRIEGLRELTRALDKVNREAGKTVKLALLEAARPVAEDAKGKLDRYQGISLGTIGPRAVAKGAVVQQRARKVTGLRGDFGGLQMIGLEAALEENESEVRAKVEAALELLGRRAGF